ncbi:3-hydroxyacyl-CoA dehydrogenase [Parasphingopyxis algicola]|uniref:3-hydroxyacyl-CoA dehydrogenase n=1 Tax=Parasphingopyxis algicola TaxID=2026624 RepID=UPI0015A32405|nr:3-hydroxyacyl-CoA dehydrogenase [Parasphingopyxis algicola]QLC23934.1 3-hydroxyacyl-CoA dehydrogenase [Parasphingopyxis algicola]
METANVACVGVGNIGRAWAISFARGGCNVRLYDTNSDNLERSLAHIAASLRDLADANLIDDPAAIGERISALSNLDEAVSECAHVQECIVENLAIKQAFFAELDSLCDPDTIIASSSSEFMASQLIEQVENSARVLVAHPFNPPYLIPLVEIAGHPGTADDAIASTRNLLEAIGMSPVVVKKEIKAFLLNRLQAAVVAEALHLVGEGYCSATDLDRAMSDGLGLRWAFMGPFQTGHLNASGGYRDYMRDDSYGGTFRRMIGDLATRNDWPYGLAEDISAEMEQLIPTDEIIDGQRWRDKRLMALLKHKAAQPDYGG